jgi:HK97 family phage prohead protease
MEGLELFKAQREKYSKVRSIPIDAIRSKFETNDRQIKGYAIVWGSKNDYNEIVVKGACSKSIEARGVNGSGKNKIVVLRQHRQSEPIAYLTKMEEDDYGLYFEAEIIKGTQASDEALAEIRQGVLNQLSYGFNYVWDKTEYDSTLDAYILREIKLFEISVVTFSSDENAQLRSFSEFQENTLLSSFSDEQIDELEKLVNLRKIKSRDEHSRDEVIPKIENKNKPKFF